MKSRNEAVKKDQDKDRLDPSSLVLSLMGIYGKSLQNRFRGRPFIPLDPPNFLDHDGAEILMIGARQNVVEELGVDLAPEQEAEATAHCSADLKIEQSVHPLEPLFNGEWV